MSRTPQEEVVHFLSDLYSVELQALAQLVSAPDIAGHPDLAADFRIHHGETERQADRVRDRLEALGGSPSAVKDAIMKLGGKGFLLFAEMQSETPGRLAVHAYSYEAMEWAGYAVLIAMAEAAGDPETASLGRAIQAEEREMMQRLEAGFDAAESVSHSDVPADELAHHVRAHLAEAHALSTQSVKLLDKGEEIAGAASLAATFARHRDRTRGQLDRIEQRLGELDDSPSLLEDTALKLGALNWGLFFQSQADTPAKLLAFLYAVKHLEIGGYELLARTARRAGDAATEALCRGILDGAREMAAELQDGIEPAVRATFREVG